jgi:hypothetical protein
MKILGDGLLRGCIPTVSLFKCWFTESMVDPDIKWDIKVQLVEFEGLGFDATDCEWFASTFFDDHISIAGAPNELKALRVFAIRIHWIEWLVKINVEGPLSIAELRVQTRNDDRRNGRNYDYMWSRSIREIGITIGSVDRKVKGGCRQGPRRHFEMTIAWLTFLSLWL